LAFKWQWIFYTAPLFGAVCVYAYYFMIGESKMLPACVCVCAFELCKNILKLRRRRLQQNPPSTLYLQHCRLLISLFVLPPVSSLLSQFYLPFMYAHVRSAPTPEKRKPPTNHFSSCGLATHSAEFSFLFLLFRYFFFFSILYYFMICFGLAHISIGIDIYGGKYF